MTQKLPSTYISVVHGFHPAGYSTPPLTDAGCKGDF